MLTKCKKCKLILHTLHTLKILQYKLIQKSISQYYSLPFYKNYLIIKTTKSKPKSMELLNQLLIILKKPFQLTISQYQYRGIKINQSEKNTLDEYQNQRADLQYESYAFISKSKLIQFINEMENKINLIKKQWKNNRSSQRSQEVRKLKEQNQNLKQYIEEMKMIDQSSEQKSDGQQIEIKSEDLEQEEEKLNDKTKAISKQKHSQSFKFKFAKVIQKNKQKILKLQKIIKSKQKEPSGPIEQNINQIKMTLNIYNEEMELMKVQKSIFQANRLEELKQISQTKLIFSKEKQGLEAQIRKLNQQLQSLQKQVEISKKQNQYSNTGIQDLKQYIYSLKEQLKALNAQNQTLKCDQSIINSSRDIEDKVVLEILENRNAIIQELSKKIGYLTTIIHCYNLNIQKLIKMEQKTGKLISCLQLQYFIDQQVNKCPAQIHIFAKNQLYNKKNERQFINYYLKLKALSSFANPANSYQIILQKQPKSYQQCKFLAFKLGYALNLKAFVSTFSSAQCKCLYWEQVFSLRINQDFINKDWLLFMQNIEKFPNLTSIVINRYSSVPVSFSSHDLQRIKKLELINLSKQIYDCAQKTQLTKYLQNHPNVKLYLDGVDQPKPQPDAIDLFNQEFIEIPSNIENNTKNKNQYPDKNRQLQYKQQLYQQRTLYYIQKKDCRLKPLIVKYSESTPILQSKHQDQDNNKTQKQSKTTQTQNVIQYKSIDKIQQQIINNEYFKFQPYQGNEKMRKDKNYIQQRLANAQMMCLMKKTLALNAIIICCYNSIILSQNPQYLYKKMDQQIKKSCSSLLLIDPSMSRFDAQYLMSHYQKLKCLTVYRNPSKILGQYRLYNFNDKLTINFSKHHVPFLGYRIYISTLLRMKSELTDTEFIDLTRVQSTQLPTTQNQWNELISMRAKLPNIKQLAFSKGYINTVSLKQLNSFPELIYIDFLDNPLKNQSIKDLAKFRSLHANATVKFNQ